MSALQNNSMLISKNLEVIEYNQLNGWNSRPDFNAEQYLPTNREPNETSIQLLSEKSSASQQKSKRDPESHRVIEKRRRDRMNRCLQDLSRLIPQNFTKKSKTRVEKTEIIEMTIKHLKHLNEIQKDHSRVGRKEYWKQFQMGYQECMSETIHFLVEVEEMAFKDGLCMRIVSHLQNHVSKLNHLENVTMKSESNIVEQSISKMSHIDTHPKQSLSKNKVKEQSRGTSKKKSSIYTSSSNSTVSNESKTRYKFKQNIKERFQAEIEKKDGKHVPENNSISPIRQLSPLTNRSETSSNSSVSSISLSTGSNSTDKHSVNSDLNDFRREITTKDVSPNLLLPGFILHPTETYYIPIQLNVSGNSQLFSENTSKALMVDLYPVNIIVNFLYSTSPLQGMVTFTDTR